MMNIEGMIIYKDIIIIFKMIFFFEKTLILLFRILVMVNLIKLSPKNKILNDTNYLNILVKKQQFLQELKI